MNYDRSENLKEGSWLDNFAGDPNVARSLDSIYAEDVLQAVSEDHYSLDEAIASLKQRTGLTVAEVESIKKVVTAKLHPKVALAERNIKKFSKEQLGKLLSLATKECSKCENAPCDCDMVMSKDLASAINNIGLEVIAEMYDTAGGNMCDKCGKIANFCGCEKGESKEEETEENDDEAEEKEEKASSKGKVTTADGDGCGCGSKKTAAKKVEKKKEVKVDKKKEDKKKLDKKKWDKKKVKVKNKKKASVWENFLSKKGYFQGADTAPMDPNTSNDPTALGYPGEVEYQQAPMAVPVGEDARPWEQKWFEGAANETKKEFLPGGTDLKVKEQWQRAKYKAYLTRFAEASKYSGFDKKSDPYEFLKKMKNIKNTLQKEQEINTQKPSDKGADPMAASMGVAAGLKKKVTNKNS